MLKSAALLTGFFFVAVPAAVVRAQVLPPSPNVPAAAAPLPAGVEIIGSSYSVELISGNAFIGLLRAATPDELEFETKDLGVVHVQRRNLKQLLPLTPEQTRRGWDDVGNGNRLFFGPTARNLRRGEGYVQDLELFLLSANYGLTDHVSLGLMASIVPAAGSYNFIGLTPKVSFRTSEKVHVGAGALLLINRQGAFGVTYANATYGSADRNLTTGLGYAYTGGGGFASAPVLMLGGGARVSRRLALMSETYFVRNRDSYGTATGVFGIGGLRFVAPRFSGGLGVAYVYANYQDSGTGNLNFRFDNGSAYPFAEVTVRFGKIKP
ncbi:MAG: hypothetical protein NVSMB30_01230 [Hymenobacter sp.]